MKLQTVLLLPSSICWLLLLFDYFTLTLACTSTINTSRFVTIASTSKKSTTSSPSSVVVTSSASTPVSSCGHTLYVNNGEDPTATNSQTATASNFVGIVGGTTALPNQFPFQAYLSIYSDSAGYSFLCGGSLINAQWIVTAAHCCIVANNPGQITINLGGNDLSSAFPITTKAVGVFPYPNYNPVTQDGDICLLKLGQAITFTNWQIQPICLPTSCATTCQSGQTVTISGWGLTSQSGIVASETLQTGNVPVVDSATCTLKFPQLTDNQECAGYSQGGTDTCQGDSGGPLSCLKGYSYYLDGVTSFGYGCGQPNSPGVYTRVCKFLGWIASITTRN